MVRTLLSLLALLLVVSVPIAALAGDDEDAEDDDEAPGIPPWLGDDDDDGADDPGDTSPAPKTPGESQGETPAPAVTSAPTPPPAAAPARSWYMDPSDLSTLKGGGLFGLGVAAGTINGLSLKIWPSRPHGIILHLGAHPSVLNALVIGVGYRVHVKPVIIPGSPVALHFNLGPSLRTRMVFFTNGTFIELAGGVAFGIAATVADVPAEFFVEAIPGFGGGVSPAGVGLGFAVDGIVGARFFFGG